MRLLRREGVRVPSRIGILLPLRRRGQRTRSNADDNGEGNGGLGEHSVSSG